MNDFASKTRVGSRLPMRGLFGLLAVLCMGPTPGDVGGCGETARDLNPVVFFDSQASIECTRCKSCQIDSDSCDAACAQSGIPQAFPDGCFPLVHDGTVCLRALSDAACEDMVKVMSDPPSVPSECNFCPPEKAPGQ